MPDYLVLLSIAETCKLKGQNFLSFLSSGAMDINGFAGRGVRPIIGTCVDVSRRQGPQPSRMLVFQVSPAFGVVVQPGGYWSLCPD